MNEATSSPVVFQIANQAQPPFASALKLDVWDYPTASPVRKELCIVNETNRVCVLDCDHVGDNPYLMRKDYAEAYGRLFVASPDLLAVAKSVIQLERSTLDRGLLDINPGDLAALYLAARRAVEKATGMPQG